MKQRNFETIPGGKKPCYCGRCGQRLEAGATFCGSCGAPQAAQPETRKKDMFPWLLAGAVALTLAALVAVGLLGENSQGDGQLFGPGAYDSAWEDTDDLVTVRPGQTHSPAAAEPAPIPEGTEPMGEQLLESAQALARAGQYRQAIDLLWQNAQLLSRETLEQTVASYMGQMAASTPLALGRFHTVRLYENGRVVAIGGNEEGQTNVSAWRNMTAIACGDSHTVGLRSDGRVLAVGDDTEGQCQVGSWRNVAQISAGDYHTVGLTADGQLLASGLNKDGQCQIEKLLRDVPIGGIACGYGHTVVLYADGRVAAIGDNDYGQLEVDDWRDVVAVYAGTFHTLGLRADGTVLAAGQTEFGACQVDSWENVRSLSAGDFFSLGLREDGTVLFCGKNNYGQGEVSAWENVVALAGGGRHSVAILANGHLIAAGHNEEGQINIGDLE